VLSIGIDDYGEVRWENSRSDATSMAEHAVKDFKKKFPYMGEWNVHEYVLLDSQATRRNIIAALQDIARRSAYNDYFVFNFSGQSNIYTADSVRFETYLHPYDITSSIYKPKKRFAQAPGSEIDQMISLKTLQEYVQQIQAQNQLFITEAGPSEQFRTELIQAMMQHSAEVASLVNKNRVIIVPKKFGIDATHCNGQKIPKGPINYAVTSMGEPYNLFDLFGEDDRADGYTYSLNRKQYECAFYRNHEYFDVFFERRFLKEYRELLGGGETTRGLKGNANQLRRELKDMEGRRFALLVGTDKYAAANWSSLSNPVRDVTALANVLKGFYGFETEVLANQPMDSIFAAIGRYYQMVQPNDQVIIYFAGHGDVDETLLSDGFVVCSDSKPPAQDIARNSYISYLKLQKMINNLAARQVLVMLDVCHGGVFDQKAFEKQARSETATENIQNRNALELLKAKWPLRTRKFLSSVGAQQAFDGAAGKHSPFVNLLLQVLTSQAKEGSGIVLLSDIYAVLVKSSLNETATLKIFPHMDDFGNVDAFSEFILIPLSAN
jgi:hypothetical protein